MLLLLLHSSTRERARLSNQPQQKKKVKIKHLKKVSILLNQPTPQFVDEVLMSVHPAAFAKRISEYVKPKKQQ
jgi:hypothetical protein